MENGDKLIKKPIYRGGKKEMSDFIHKNLQYPEKALKEKIEGVVAVRIDIDDKGKVTKGKVTKKLGHGCDEEAVRVCGLLEFIVDHKRKKRLTFHKTINVYFRLPKTKKVTPKKNTPLAGVATGPKLPIATHGSASSTMGYSMNFNYSYVSKEKK